MAKKVAKKAVPAKKAAAVKKPVVNSKVAGIPKKPKEKLFSVRCRMEKVYITRSADYRFDLTLIQAHVLLAQLDAMLKSNAPKLQFDTGYGWLNLTRPEANDLFPELKKVLS